MKILDLPLRDPQTIQALKQVLGIGSDVQGTGLSAYQVAVLNGFVGTPTQWLASLNGAQGPGFAYRGTYALGTTYGVNDVVLHLGSVYRVHTLHTTAGALATTNLELWASKGDPGAVGPVGPTGGVIGADLHGGGAVTTYGDLPVFNFGRAV